MGVRAHASGMADAGTPGKSSLNRVYLNNAATAWPKAPGVADAVRRAIETPPSDAGRATHQCVDVMSECRTRLAALLRVPNPSRVVLTPSATHSLNLAILGVGLKPGDHVVTTIAEHNSVLRPLNHLRERLGVRVTCVGPDGQGAIDTAKFLTSLSDRPSVVILTHASNVTGRVYDVRDLFGPAKDAGAITILDASQSVGHIDVHPIDLHADIAAFTGHKGLKGPVGTGGLYVAEGLQLDQVLVGGTGVRSDLRMHPTDMPMRLEAGTPNTASFAGLLAALDWGSSHCIAEESEARLLTDKLRDGLRQIPGVTLFDDVETERVPIVSFRLNEWSVQEAGYILSESFGIVCRTGLHCAPMIHGPLGSAPDGTIRFSVSGLNTDADIEYALDTIRGMTA